MRKMKSITQFEKENESSILELNKVSNHFGGSTPTTKSVSISTQPAGDDTDCGERVSDDFGNHLYTIIID